MISKDVYPDNESYAEYAVTGVLAMMMVSSAMLAESGLLFLSSMLEG